MAEPREPDPDVPEQPADAAHATSGEPDGRASDVASAHDADAGPADGTAGEAHSVDAAAGDQQYGRHWYGRRRSKPRKPRRKAPWWELPALVVLAIGIAILVKSFVVQPFFIPSDSMEKTLHGCPGCHGDRILVNKPIYDFRDPHPGDIVVFHDPKQWGSDEPTSKPPSNPVVRAVRGFGQLVGFVPPDGQVLVKRVIATGGQTVKGDAEGHVMISTTGPQGSFRTLKEPYVYAPKAEGAQSAFGPVTVPKGRLWVMGDHRTDSADSRYHCSADGQSGTSDDLNCDATESTVPVGNVIGKAFVIAWPPSRWRTLGTPSDFTSAAQAAGPALPGLASAAMVLPVFVVRRRRRR
ncbi:signal peptidase I [uncultured Jatrophihabitans sp.]|uniref:signal peptidase I n=1 Tax=uncultured Jatrophihabitans sp. TaxID=1610747 RepID=UPI0035CB8479